MSCKCLLGSSYGSAAIGGVSYVAGLPGELVVLLQSRSGSEHSGDFTALNQQESNEDLLRVCVIS